MTSADELFRGELEKRNIEYSISSEGLYEVDLNQGTLNVSLENISRDFERDGDADVVVRFVDKLATDFLGETPDWESVKPYIRYSLEHTDYEPGLLDGALLNPLSDELIQLFVYTSSDGTRITWINESLLEEWDVTREQIADQAERNMAAIVADTKCEVEDVHGNKLGMLATEEIPFKASLILSPAFRELVSPTLGWPVCVVVPCRDFVYVIENDNHEFLGRLAGTVLREYHNSGYPLTKDVLQVSDEGIISIGTYPDPE